MANREYAPVRANARCERCYTNYEGMPASVDGINIGASVSNPGGSLDKTIIDLSNFVSLWRAILSKCCASTTYVSLNFRACRRYSSFGENRDIYLQSNSVT